MYDQNVVLGGSGHFFNNSGGGDILQGRAILYPLERSKMFSPTLMNLYPNLIIKNLFQTLILFVILLTAPDPGI